MFLLVLIDADTYRGYSSCVSFRCTILGDEMYLKCPAPVDVHNDAADPLSLNSKDIFEEIGYRASQHWVPETDKPYICSNCGKGYTHIFTLNRHRRTVCGKRRNNGGKWKCTRCKRSYATKGNLDRHIQYACGVKRKFCCFVCHSMFTQRCSLIRHLKTFHDSNNDD
ncbi:oocyte zinc finger protein XlCOF6-like isoform X2 [Bombus vosnesenskii]|uniref:Oocyte zinc finger protein XlCOF6-like isoform X2 n=2 Tax=Pyrobombus TaxID=144703 RepID=A0A6J3L360_9HYME|nr:oocyte zinc finger protein XlCOF6-like isoform X2 [Bombus bifarius]XP_033358891.1 oocyte zinc finger protein XlCOF6-like isoform X2 [Bombus vosnesenskii]